MRAFPDPVFVFAFGQQVDIEDEPPFLATLDVVIEQHPPPASADVVFVAPEVVDVITAHRRRRNAFVRVIDLEIALFQLREKGQRLVVPERDGVLLLDPGERFVALDVLEPGVVVFRKVILRDRFCRILSSATREDNERHGPADELPHACSPLFQRPGSLPRCYTAEIRNGMPP